MKKVRSLLFFLLAIAIGCMSFALAACGGDDGTTPPDASDDGNDPDDGNEPDDGDPAYDGLFAGEGSDYALSADYTLTQEDVKGTGGTDGVTLNKACTFDLGGHTLDLGGLTLRIATDEKAEISFENGTITNGVLDVSAPNGDIEFSGTTISESVTYELEAASDTIRFSNAILTGNCTVKSGSRVQIEYSAVSNITLTGSGRLEAGTRANLGSVTVSASGASVDVSPAASVSSMALNAAADVKVAGAVDNVTVGESATGGEAALTIEVTPSASVAKLELNAAADVSLAGTVSAVTVGESAADAKVSVAENASVTKLEVKAAAEVSLAGTVSAVAVSEKAANAKVSVAENASVAQMELNAPAQLEVNGGIGKVVVNESASGTSVKLNEGANVDTIAVAAQEIGLTAAGGAGVGQVAVTDNVNTENISGDISVSTVTEDEMADLIAHEHVYYTVSSQPATCTQDGVRHMQCAWCDATKDEPIEALGHDYIYSVVKQPTADESGRGKYTCSRCGDSYEVEIAKLGSLTLAGLEKLYSLIPDGTYTLKTGANEALTAAQPNGNKIEISDLEIIIKVAGDSLQGTIDGRLLATSEGKTLTDADFRAVLAEGNEIYLFVVYDYLGEGDVMLDDEQTIYATLTGAIFDGLSLATGIDLEAVYEALYGAAEGLTGEELGDIATKVLQAIADKTFESTAVADGTKYTFSAQKLNEFITALGGKTPAALIDEAFGEGTFAKLQSYAEGLADIKVSELADDIFAIAENSGISQPELVKLASAVLTRVTGSAIDVDELILGYGDMTVAEAMAEYMNASGAGQDVTAEQMKEQLAGIVLNIFDAQNGMAHMTVQQIIDSGMFELPFDFTTLEQMVQTYAAGLNFEVTVSGDGRLTALNATFEADMPGGETDEYGNPVLVRTQVLSLVWNEGDELPEINVNVMGVIAALTEGENGEKQISANIMGMEVTLVYSETQTGALITIDAEQGGTVIADVTLTVTDGTDGCTIDVSGTLNGMIENMFGGSAAHPDDDTGDGGQQQPAEPPEDYELNGTLDAEQGTGDVNADVWAEHKELKQLFYHMNMTLASGNAPYSYPVTVEYSNDEDGDYYAVTMHAYTAIGLSEYTDGGVTYYYGTLLEARYYSRVGSVNGMPELAINVHPDCNDVLCLNVVSMNAPSVETIYTIGTFTRDEYGVYTAVTVSNQISRPEQLPLSNPVSGVAYYNTQTGEITYQSAHSYNVEAAYAPGSANCDDGLILTYTCEHCGDKYTRWNYGHFYEEEITKLPTQCNDESYIGVNTCIMCGYEYTDLSLYEHKTHEAWRKEILTDADYELEVENLTEMLKYEGYDEELYGSAAEAAEAKISEQYVRLGDLEASGLDVAGFYYGTAELEHCALCGLNVYTYTYNTNSGTDPDDCTCRTATVIEYKGNADYAGFTKKLVSQTHGHAFVRDGEKTDPDAIESVKTELNNILLAETGMTADLSFADAYYYSYSYCPACGQKDSLYIDLYSELSKDNFHISVHYNDDGSTNSIEIHNADFAIAYAQEHYAGLYTPEGTADYAYVRIEGSGEYVTCYFDMTNGDRLDITLYDYDSDKRLEVDSYDYSECLNTRTTYEYANGTWQEVDSYTSEQHKYSGRKEYGENCREDGRYSVSSCDVCGKTNDSNFDVQYYHSYVYSSDFDFATSALYLTGSEYGLAGLTEELATIKSESFCGDCETLMDVVLTLNGDWTLTNNVYIRAEGIVIDLNGHNIDLNGYRLTVYSYDGRYLTITDNAFDTSSVEGFDPEAPEYAASVTDGKGTGLLTAFNSGEEEIIIGTVNIGCDIFLSDCDNRYTISDTLSAMDYQAPETAVSGGFLTESELNDYLGTDGVKYYNFGSLNSFYYNGEGAAADGGRNAVLVMQVQLEYNLDGDPVAEALSFSYALPEEFNGDCRIYVNGERYDYLYNSGTFTLNTMDMGRGGVFEIVIEYSPYEGYEGEGIMITPPEVTNIWAQA